LTGGAAFKVGVVVFKVTCALVLCIGEHFDFYPAIGVEGLQLAAHKRVGVEIEQFVKIAVVKAKINRI
jgi:hypothetical protein